MSQKELSDWIEDWNASLGAADDAGQQMSIVKAIAAVRTITIKASSESDHAVSETRTSRSAMDRAPSVLRMVSTRRIRIWPHWAAGRAGCACA